MWPTTAWNRYGVEGVKRCRLPGAVLGAPDSLVLDAQLDAYLALSRYSSR